VKRPFPCGRAGIGPPLPIILPLPASILGKSERPTPQTINKAVEDMLVRAIQEKADAAATEISVLRQGLNLFAPTQRKMLLKALAKEMSDHADRLEYEAAAAIRDEIQEIRRQYGT
jgi:excinuclease ABC subunit B